MDTLENARRACCRASAQVEYKGQFYKALPGERSD